MAIMAWTGHLAAWIAFFEHWQEEDKMSEIAYPPVQQALAGIKHLSADAETRRLAFVRERALSDEASLMRQEREKGRAEGLQEALNRLVESGMDEQQARRILGF